MSENTVIKRNILALTSNNTELSALLTTQGKSNQVHFLKARSGHLVPTIFKDEKDIPLHSTFNPEREGNRFPELYPESGCLVFLGIGAGYHILPFLKNDNISNILIIDKSAAVLKSILEQIDMHHIFIDARVKILIDYTPAQIQEYILSTYLPALLGNLRSIPLWPRFNCEKDYFTKTVRALQDVINKIADDYTVQAKFGKKWFVNTLSNLKVAQNTTITLSPQKSVIVTGAGPSLENQIRTLRNMYKEYFLIASDTSLPCLLDYDISPDLVLSIDCQQITYHHFLHNYPQHIPLLLDLASPPILTRISDKVLFFSSGHPFSQYVNNNWRQFPFIDTSGGNVSHAAISLANQLGAQEIYLAGIDFSFPEGKAYARGTYLYPYFRSLENRFSNLESLFFSFIHRNKQILREKFTDYIRYTTRPMINYKERLESTIINLKSQVIPLKGKGVPLNIKTQRSIPTRSTTNILFSAGPPQADWKDFLKNYLKGLKKLPPPFKPVIKYLSNLTAIEKNLWTTQLPAASVFRENSYQKKLEGPELLTLVNNWTQETVSRYTTS